MKKKRKTKSNIRKAYFKPISNPSSLDRFAHSYLVPKFIFAFVK